MSYDEVGDATASVSRNLNMLCEIITGKVVHNLDCLSIGEVVNMDAEVAINGEFMSGGGCVRKKR